MADEPCAELEVTVHLDRTYNRFQLCHACTVDLGEFLSWAKMDGNPLVEGAVEDGNA